jgi:hypothetical protein
MESKALTEALEEIQRLMASDEALGDQDRELLARLHAQMGALLAQEPEDRAEEDRDTLLDLVRDGVDQFEVQHPSLVEVVGRVAEALSGMGI